MSINILTLESVEISPIEAQWKLLYIIGSGRSPFFDCCLVQYLKLKKLMSVHLLENPKKIILKYYASFIIFILDSIFSRIKERVSESG